MPQPLDYRAVRPQETQAEDAVATAKGARRAIPLEFESVITRTKDQGGASAVEAQLRREGIEVFRTHEGPVVDQTTELLVRAPDRDRALAIATAIFNRRHKLRSFPR